VDDDINNQVDYWNRIGPTKTFAHPVNLDRLKELVPPTASIVDFGCGSGRVLKILLDHGYRNLAGFDPAPSMIAAAGERLPGVKLNTLPTPTQSLPLPDSSTDAVLLFAVLTCVPSEAAQRAIIREIERVLRPDGLLYISDLWLQRDDRNRERYEQGVIKFGTYGIFELPEGVVLRHHDREWIRELTAGFSRVALDEFTVETMNGHVAEGFQWFGRRRAALVPSLPT
jgi:SAM-dependent methyltransferase